MAPYHDIPCTLHAGPTTGWVPIREQGLAALWQLAEGHCSGAATFTFHTKPWSMQAPKWPALEPSREGDVKINTLKHSGKWKSDPNGVTLSVAQNVLSSCLQSCAHIRHERVGWILSCLCLLHCYLYSWDCVGFTPTIGPPSHVCRRNGATWIFLGQGSCWQFIE